MVFKDPAGSKQAQAQLAAQEKKILHSLALLKNKDKAPPSPAIPTYQNNLINYTTPPHKMHCLKKLLEMEYDNNVCIGHPSCVVYCQCKEKAKAFEDAIAKYVIKQQYTKYLANKDKVQAPLKPQGYPLFASGGKSTFDSSDDNGQGTSDDEEEENTLPQVKINII